MQFRKIQLSDRETFDSYFNKINVRTCDASFASSYVWKDHYNGEFTIIEDTLVIRWKKGFVSFNYPVGDKDEKIKAAIDKIREYCKENQIPLCLYNVTEDIAEKLEQMYPGEMGFVFSRDTQDYVYDTEALITLRGKKYHGKRNHINKFKENHVWSYESITDENRQECLEMLEAWKKANCKAGVEEDEEKEAETCAARTALLHLEELGLVGGAIRAEGNIIAFAMGESLGNDTFVVHFEKAFSMIQGAYPIINQQFAEHEAIQYRYINREEDCGDEGLRKAKLSYQPVMMLSRGLAYLKAEKELLNDLKIEV